MVNLNNQPMTLNSFIKENSELLSAMAVLVAVTTFVSDLPIQWISNVLTCLSIAGLVTIWFELSSLLPKVGTIRLHIFRYVILLGLGSIIFYWLLAFRVFWHFVLFIPLFFLMFFMMISLLKPFGEIAKIRKFFAIGSEKNWWQKICKIVYYVFIFYACVVIFAVSVNASLGFNYLLDLIKVNFH